MKKCVSLVLIFSLLVLLGNLFAKVRSGAVLGAFFGAAALGADETIQFEGNLIQKSRKLWKNSVKKLDLKTLSDIQIPLGSSCTQQLVMAKKNRGPTSLLDLKI